jgi:iron-sulfur cluster assembly protein
MVGDITMTDPQSFTHLNGTELDYKNELMQSGFVFNNPNAKGTCGCGTSFST